MGHEVVLTTRKHPDTTALAKALGEEFITIGKYDPESAYTRLLEGTRRQLQFCRMFKENAPNFAISHQSPEMCRVAFGLSIPVITTSDAPHATAPNKLKIGRAHV
jgi:predicted glycosyltransferase